MKNNKQQRLPLPATNQADLDTAFLHDNLELKENSKREYAMVILRLDLVKMRANLIRIGKEMKTLEILPYFKTSNGLFDDDSSNIDFFCEWQI